MRPGVRTKLFLVSLLLMVVVGGASAIYLERSLRGVFERRVEDQLRQHARSVRQSLEFGRPGRDRLDALITGLGRATDARITLIDPEGRVLADSEVPEGELDALDDHGTRPEVIEAEERGLGVARRYSETLGAHMLYVAIPADPQEDGGATAPGLPPDLAGGTIRTAMPLEIVDEVVGQLRRLVAVAAFFGLLLATVMSLLASHLLSRALRRLVEHARALTRGQGQRIDVMSSDEIGRLAGSFNELAEGLEITMATLASERARFEAILDSMSEAVLVIDPQLSVLLMNPATTRLLGLDARAIGKPLDVVLPIEPLRTLAERGALAPAQADFSLDGPPARSLLARATPLAKNEGTVLVLHDVTDVRRLENIRKDFVANVSHELRTPVSIVQANAETLLDGALSDPVRARTFVEALHRNAERLSRIIADLLDLSRLEAGRYRFEMTGVDLPETIRHALDAVQDKADRRRQVIEVSVAEDQAVIADAKALEQVLSNLLENAIKYTPEGGHISVRAEERTHELRLEVQDDGPGIKPEHRSRIFERFYRIDPGRSRDMGGTGLGLAIVKHFMESMGGRVGVEPAFPRGSVFWVSLPVDEDFDDESEVIGPTTGPRSLA